MLSDNPTYPSLLPDRFKPSQTVTKGRWIAETGNHVTAGVRAAALAGDDFSARQLEHVGDEPGERLTAIRLGYGETELGGTIPDNSFVTYDAVTAKTIVANVATTPSEQIVGFMAKGGIAGDRRQVLVLTMFDMRIASAAIPDLAGGATLADVIAKVNVILARDRAQGTTAV
jgi:hypothetical protein